MIVTFLYRVREDPTLHYGKYIGPCPAYEEGLDRALLEIMTPLFQRFYGEVVIRFGVLSVDREVKDYYSEEEKHVFDVLYCKWPVEEEIFFQGAKI
jgi:hypothetical protein